MTLEATDVRSLQAFADAAAASLEGAHPIEVLRWAGDTFGDRLCLTSSMGDAVLATLAAEAVPGIDVVFLDTGYHFGETLQTRDRVAAELDVTVVTVKPELTVAQQNIQYGQSLYSRDSDLCCAMRKVEPLDRGLAPYDAWASGLRRDESYARRHTPVVGVDKRRNKIKVNPLACWTQADVDRFVAERDVIVNPLVDRGFASIGCAPCTRPVAAGEDQRAGRWSGTEKTECGIHL
ncbi:phosphoadenylyl-sulfate reductase [Cryptosporangium phraense]|uniref:Adenosine 5'-phosphosulfate reductase n=1 Tax=Cryptosporangium phraense TaxID=2593070 RepID=A0A545AJZ6_9ACTN|nr:phosphoadenylyl-sulfate reductase [Cryptosporangium phraense]TQS41570.1 phosphoadenylyl-sulfate reductase [Cryptosporangium phraense]